MIRALQSMSGQLVRRRAKVSHPSPPHIQHWRETTPVWTRLVPRG